MRFLGTLLAIGLLLLGALFLLAAVHPDAVAQHKTLPRLVVAGVLVAAAALLLILAWKTRGAGVRPLGGEGGASGFGQQEAPGRLSLKPIVCPHCGGQVDPASAHLNPEGTLSVTCGYCQAAFLVQEDPKW